MHFLITFNYLTAINLIAVDNIHKLTTMQKQMQYNLINEHDNISFISININIVKY